MIRPGLVSISFRKVPPGELIRSARDAGLAGIEWGGDVHVPHGELECAREVGRLTREAGLECAAYGSYFRAGEGSGSNPPFARVLESARALQTKVIRVWAGNRGSRDGDEAYRALVRDDLLRIADEAGRHEIAVATEYHGGTLTDSLESCLALLDGALHPFLGTYWQPPVGMDPEKAMQSLERVLPRLMGLHVFHWWPRQERLPLADAEPRWKRYLALAKRAPRAAWALLEFIPDDRLEYLCREAASLRKILVET